MEEFLSKANIFCVFSPQFSYFEQFWVENVYKYVVK